jgi:Tol biopolymer transport system component
MLATRKSPETFSGSGVSWSPDGKFIAASAFVKGEPNFMSIVLTPVDGGAAKPVSGHKWRLIEQIASLPDGSGLLGIAVAETGESLQQIWFFPASGEDARRITTDLNQYSGISLTADGEQLLTINWQNRENIWTLPGGKSEEARMLSNNIHARYRVIALAPDGRIVFPSNENAGDHRDIWIINPDGSGARQLTSNAGANILPCVTGDGRYIVFASNRADLKTYHIWRMNIDGSEPVQLTKGDGERAPKCSPDGQTIYYLSGGPNVGPEKSRLWKISIDGGEAVQLNDYPTGWLDVSPDGKFIAARIKPDPKAPFKLGIIPESGGKPAKIFDFNFTFNSQVRWKPDGSAITFFKTENGVSNFWEQSVEGGQPRQLTKFTSELILGFDWSKDGNLICARGYEARDPVLISNFR